MTDILNSHIDSLSAPARRCFVITPDNANAVPLLPKAIRAPSDGVIMLRAVDSDADVAHPVLAGELLCVRAAYVRATGTTVTGMIMGYA